MIKKTFTYKNFNDVEVTKDFYFHLSKADFVELALGGEWEENMKKAVQTQDKVTIYREFRRLIGMAVGMRTEDGEDFLKPTDFRDKFMNSPAFDELIMDLFTSEDMGTNFIKGCLPSDMQDKLQAELEKAKANPGVDPFAEEPAWIREKRVPTPQEFAAATEAQKRMAFGMKLNQS